MELKLDITNSLKFIEDSELEKLLEEAGKACKTLIKGEGAGSEFTGWLQLCDGKNEDELLHIEKATKRIQEKSEALVVIGIGGSYLGARAALDFIKSPNYNMLKKETPDIYFIGNGLSADALSETIEMIGNRDFSVNVISKSGTTTEPAVAFRIFRDILEEKYGKEEANRRIYATTDAKRGVLRSLAEENGWETFVVPDDVGGRFSVFTPVGLLPMAVAGIDIRAVLSAGKTVFDACAKGKNAAVGRDNPAFCYAALRNGFLRNGKKTEIFAAFEPALRFTGEWWKQLFGESEGKDGKGLFPASVDFTADLHSMGQYIQQGQRILIETFVKVENSRRRVVVPFDEKNADGLNFMAEKELSWANHNALRATAAAHLDGGVPNIMVTIPDRSEKSFGELIAFFELSCGISGYMLGVNPFNQPGVEAYKVNMFALLGKPGYEDKLAEFEARS